MRPTEDVSETDVSESCEPLSRNLVTETWRSSLVSRITGGSTKAAGDVTCSGGQANTQQHDNNLLSLKEDFCIFQLLRYNEL